MENNSLIKNIDFNENSSLNISYKKFFLMVAFAVIAGVLVGFLVKKLTTKSVSQTISKTNSKTTVGVVDKKTFKDQAEGVLKEGGIDGEGNFHLERPGGESQNVYLTSTTIDLSQYLNKKVRVWGQTFSSEKAGWLMDVGLVEILK
ncbi:MAG: hypothetical protein ACPLRN_00835 [Microgenomates group bacterium]